MQNCEEIFISPIFKTPKHKNFLDILKFNLITKETKVKIVALGGINDQNLRKIRKKIRKHTKNVDKLHFSYFFLLLFFFFFHVTSGP